MNELNDKASLDYKDQPMHERGEGLKTKQSNTTKAFFITIGVALILLIALWVWKSMEVSSTKETAEIERQTIKEKATRHIVQSHEEHLKLLAKAYVWAVRAEMMQGNINQVNLFASDMVKEKNFQRIVIANDKGIIVSSTNKKDEGQPFSTIADEAALSSNNTTVQNESDSILILTSPIMGFNNRLGTLLIKYAVKPPGF
jgi:1,2-phenylacetyl-CoA epoxidase catalytic subunit